MIKSMTGYGRASTKIQIGSCNIEIRSLNSRNLDIKFSGLSLSAELEQKSDLYYPNKFREVA